MMLVWGPNVAAVAGVGWVLMLLLLWCCWWWGSLVPNGIGVNWLANLINTKENCSIFLSHWGPQFGAIFYKYLWCSLVPCFYFIKESLYKPLDWGNLVPFLIIWMGPQFGSFFNHHIGVNLATPHGYGVGCGEFIFNWCWCLVMMLLEVGGGVGVDDVPTFDDVWGWCCCSQRNGIWHQSSSRIWHQSGLISPQYVPIYVNLLHFYPNMTRIWHQSGPKLPLYMKIVPIFTIFTLTFPYIWKVVPFFLEFGTKVPQCAPIYVKWPQFVPKFTPNVPLYM